MLTRKTYTPDIEGEAVAILPGCAGHIRRQVAREQARLLEMPRSIGNPKPAGPVKSHYHVADFWTYGARGSLRLRRLSEKNLRFAR
jgi:hypothetical protein